MTERVGWGAPVVFFAGFAVGAVGVLLAAYNAETSVSVPKKGMVNCAVVERPELRETEGIARYLVTFFDGELQTITCISDDTEGDATE